ncbi:MAG: hypothetical protein OXB86_06265 [Bdellovibrionales bacterium]|nr:hypothetical protein [Bdellovibrionales bacterium]
MKTKIHEQKPATPEEVWQLLRENEKILQENERKREKANEEWNRRFQETDRQMKETDRQMKETDRQMKETDRQMKESGKRIDKIYNLFNSQWSKLVESLVEGKLIELLQARGIDVNETYSRLQRSYRDENGNLEQREIDIIAANGKEVVAVEVKTTLRPDDVKHFMNTLKIFKNLFFRYKNETIYGAVAYLKSDAEAAAFAERQGLFVIRATGDSASLVNKPTFKPKAF